MVEEPHYERAVGNACCGLVTASSFGKIRRSLQIYSSPRAIKIDRQPAINGDRRESGAVIEATDANSSTVNMDDKLSEEETEYPVEYFGSMTANGHGETNASSFATEDADSQEGSEVWLHIYDLGPIIGRLNEAVLRSANLGAFHCGIEVLGDEWSFQGFHDAWDDPTISGVVRNEPRSHPAYIYRESMLLGRTPLGGVEIDNIIDKLMEEWPANSYHLVAHNCITFAEELAKVLQAPEPFPSWVRGAADAFKAPPLEAITECGWSWFKWWSQRQAEQEVQMELQQEGRS